MPLFSSKTFRYFEAAKKNKKDKDWLKANRAAFEKEVKAPLAEFLEEMNQRFGHKIPSVAFSPRKIARPLRSMRTASKRGWVRTNGSFYLAENSESFFEWNPGIYFQIGAEKKENLIGVGLYMPSGRQLLSLRKALLEDYRTVDRLLRSPKLRKYWGGLAEEKYRRFPKEFSPDHPAAKYLWYKQFILSRSFTRKEVLSKDFVPEVLKSFEAALPFFAWVRKAAGQYDRAAYLREKRARELGEDDLSHLAEDERQALSAQ